MSERLQPWIRVIQPEEATGRLRDIYEETLAKRGRLAEVHKIHSLNPESLVAHMELYLTLMYGKSPLYRREREWIGVVVSRTNRCPYCVAHHTDALRRYEKDENFIRALSRFAEKLTLQPARMTAEDVDRLREVGYDDRAILDIVQIAAYFNLVNRIVLGLGVPLEPEEEREGYRY